jgi:hypothetical protein
LSADQGNAFAQMIYGVMLDGGDGIDVNKPLAADDFALSVTQS